MSILLDYDPISHLLSPFKDYSLMLEYNQLKTGHIWIIKVRFDCIWWPVGLGAVLRHSWANAGTEAAFGYVQL